MKTFQELQLAFARHLRAPELHSFSEAIEDRRIGIYRDLIYNNMEGFIRGAFPVLHSILATEDWHRIIRDFVRRHSCQTPYFLEISQEFLAYLMRERGIEENDPPFLLELAHYEWIELALDIAPATISSESDFPIDPMTRIARVSPLVCCLEYHYPLHKVSRTFQPREIELTHLLVYRNRVDQVKFMVVNALTFRLINLLQHSDTNLRIIFKQICDEAQSTSVEHIINDGLILVKQLFDLSIISHFD